MLCLLGGGEQYRVLLSRVTPTTEETGLSSDVRKSLMLHTGSQALMPSSPGI